MKPTISTNNKSNLNDKTGDPRIKLGIRVKRTAISNQLITMLNGLKKYDGIETSLLVKEEEFRRHEAWYKREFSNHSIIRYSREEPHKLTPFDAVILPEANSDLYYEFPKDMVKIGLPHGADVPLEQTIINYGGGYYADYILGITEKNKPDPERFKNLFPSNFRNHIGNHFHEIPVGIPKLDDFINEVTLQAGNQPPTIVHHLSNLGVEPPESLKLIVPTLKKLLESFPNHRITFRPIMTDWQHPIVKACRALGTTYNNFHFSESESYVQDYASAIAMVCHRPYKLHLFSLATGRPTFLCHPDLKIITSDDDNFISCPESQLIDNLNAYLNTTSATIPLSSRIEKCRQAGIYNPGSAIEHLVNGIKLAVRRESHPEWKCYSLTGPKTSPIDLKTYMSLQLVSAEPANMAFLAFLEKNPENPELLLIIADCYARKHYSLKDYFYRLSLHYFCKLAKHNSLNATLKTAMTHWWSSCGHEILNFLIADSKYKQIPIAEEIMRLTDHPAARENSTGSEEKSNFVEMETLIDLQTFTLTNHTGPIALYGSRALAHKFTNTHPIDIQLIVDPDIGMQGKELAGHIIRSPEALLDTDIPVLICSYTHILDVFIFLRKKLGNNRKLFAICKDEKIANLLPLLKTMDYSQENQTNTNAH